MRFSLALVAIIANMAAGRSIVRADGLPAGFSVEKREPRTGHNRDAITVYKAVVDRNEEGIMEKREPRTGYNRDAIKVYKAVEDPVEKRDRKAGMYSDMGQ